MRNLIVLDLDGTILRKDKTVSDKTVNTLLECKKRGANILFATARPPRDAYKYVPVKLRDNPIIAYNGACVTNQKLELLHRKEILKETVLQALEICSKNGYNNLCLEIDDKLYSNFDTTLFFGDAKTEIVDFGKLNFKGAFKCIVCSNEKISPKLLKEFPQEIKGVITDNGTICQIMSKDSSKWTSVQEIMKETRISKENVYAFGDDYNDIDMLQNAGFGVAMGNAEEDVKNVAKYTTDTNMNDGVAKFLEINYLNRPYKQKDIIS